MKAPVFVRGEYNLYSKFESLVRYSYILLDRELTVNEIRSVLQIFNEGLFRVNVWVLLTHY